MSIEYQPVVETVGLSKRFGGVSALSNIDFRLQQGELRCLIGPNGAGKSTFFRLLTGQLQPTMGTVSFFGRDITRLRRHEIARLGIGIKNQTPDVLDGVSVRENIYLAARFAEESSVAGDHVDQLLNEMSLTSIANHQVGQLAHGQRQWVEIAMVLARSPKLILLDEPSAGMSSEERCQMADLLVRLKGQATIVVVEHDMQFIKKIASFVTVFHQGRIVKEDTIAKILADPFVRDIYLGRQEAS